MVSLSQCAPRAPATNTVAKRRLDDASELQQPLAGLEVCVLVGLALGGERAVGGPHVDEGLHGLELVGFEQIEGRGREDKVTEATVELLLEVDVVEGVGEVGPVEMGVDAEHLAEDGLADVDEVLGEARALADPVGLATGAGELGQRRRRDGGVVRKGDARRIRGEDGEVVNLAGDPALHQCHVLVGRQLDRLAAAVEPGEGVVAVRC